VCFGLEKLNIISLLNPDEGIVEKFSVDPEHFRAILDVQLDSNLNDAKNA